MTHQETYLALMQDVTNSKQMISSYNKITFEDKKTILQTSCEYFHQYLKRRVLIIEPKRTEPSFEFLPLFW